MKSVSSPSRALTILAVGDLHASDRADGPGKRGDLAVILLRKALLRLSHAGVKPDLVVLLGDLVHERPARADAWLSALLAEPARAGIPMLAVAGNHDADPARLAAMADSETGLHRIGDYGFFVFQDDYAASGAMCRRPDHLLALRQAAAEHPGMPLVVLQHNPVFPPIREAYPYLPGNAQAVMDAYRDCGVLLSLSGHYHKGQPACEQEGVTYHTVPAMYQTPFGFSLIRLKEREVTVEPMQLRLPVDGLADCHCHTQFAYCATTVTAEDDIDIARTLGVGRQYLTEHTFQLYFEKPEAMAFAWKRDPSIAERVWATPERCRMAAYRRWATKLRSPFVRIGLEVDMMDDGRLLLAPEDAEGWDVLVGSLHEVTGHDRSKTQAQAEALFLADTERLLATGIHILAHPFRFFRRKKLRHPEHLYVPLARLLAQSGVAAEINFHTNTPDPAFARICVEHGVRLSLGSDSHELAEVGELWPHLDVLRRAGVAPEDFPRVLFH